MSIILTGHFNAFITLWWVKMGRGEWKREKHTARVLSPVYRIVFGTKSEKITAAIKVNL